MGICDTSGSTELGFRHCTRCQLCNELFGVHKCPDTTPKSRALNGFEIDAGPISPGTGDTVDTYCTTQYARNQCGGQKYLMFEIRQTKCGCGENITRITIRFKPRGNAYSVPDPRQENSYW